MINESARRGLPISFLSTGQGIPDDLEPASKQGLVALVRGAELLADRPAEPLRARSCGVKQSASQPSKTPSTYQARSGGLSVEEREQTILEHLPQVRLIARRIHERLPESVSLDDLISTGIVGLISAIDRFDSAHNVKLKTYAEYKIRGAILDSLRSLDWAPRQQRKRSKQIEAAIASAEQRLHRTPGEEEIAQQLGLDITEYHEWLVEIRGLNLGSLENASPDDESRDLLRFVSGDEENWPSRVVERSELKRLLVEAIARMPDVEKDGVEFVLSRGDDAARDFEDRESARVANFATEDTGHSAAAYLHGKALADDARSIERGSCSSTTDLVA